MILLVFAEQCLGQDLDRVDPIMGGQQGNDKVLHDAWRCVDLVLKTTCSQVRLPVQIPVTNSCPPACRPGVRHGIIMCLEATRGT